MDIWGQSGTQHPYAIYVFLIVRVGVFVNRDVSRRSWVNAMSRWSMSSLIAIHKADKKCFEIYDKVLLKASTLASFQMASRFGY